MADPVSVPDAFVMRGARAAIAQGLAHVEEQVTALERSVVENPGLAFDLAKTLVESACRTILTERKQPHAPDDDLLKLFKAVTTFLPLSPPPASNSSGGHKSLKQTLNGLHTALQGVCELRNEFGFASHGSDGSRLRMESIQAMLAAQAADAIVGFLHATHQQDRAVHRTAPLRFEDRVDFNDFVDEAHDTIQIFELSFRPSEVLFRVDHEAYRDALASFDASEEDGVTAAVESPPSSVEGSS
jgi:Abortive infection C-terminus